MIDWKAIAKIEEKRFSERSMREKFVFFLLLQYRNPYEWGKEMPEGADCSGAICLALAAATGFVIRTTADALFTTFFTVRNPGETDIQAVFFIAQYDRPHGDRIAKRGEVVHVAGLIHDDLAMNVAMPRADIMPLASLTLIYSRKGCDCAVRGLDIKKLEEANRTQTDRFALDPGFEALFDETGVSTCVAAGTPAGTHGEVQK